MAPQSKANTRRIRIADAALALLAREGTRGLTHRAIDRELALPDGSTSYYYSTHSALLLAAAERLAALDMADVEEAAERAGSGSGSGVGSSGYAALRRRATHNGLDGAVALVERWLAPVNRTRSLARVELLLTAARDPAFRFMQKARASFIERASGGRTSEAARIAATTLVALADGLLLHGLVVRKLSRGDVRLMFERIRPSEVERPRARRGTQPKRAVKAPKR